MDLKIFFFLGLLFGYLVGVFLVPKIIDFIRNKIQDKTQTEYSNESHLGWNLPQIHHNDIFYVDTKTWKCHDIDELIMIYGRQGLCKLLAEGQLVNESIYEKRKKSSNS